MQMNNVCTDARNATSRLSELWATTPSVHGKCREEHIYWQGSTESATDASVPMKKDRSLPYGHYVYAWLDNGAAFYIGKGIGSRRTQAHSNDDGTPAACEVWRSKIGTRFESVVIRDGLTDEGARLVESVLIDLIRPACNITSGMSRQERPPLTLPRNIVAVA